MKLYVTQEWLKKISISFTVTNEIVGTKETVFCIEVERKPSATKVLGRIINLTGGWASQWDMDKADPIPSYIFPAEIVTRCNCQEKCDGPWVVREGNQTRLVCGTNLPSTVGETEAIIAEAAYACRDLGQRAEALAEEHRKEHGNAPFAGSEYAPADVYMALAMRDIRARGYVSKAKAKAEEIPSTTEMTEAAYLRGEKAEGIEAIRSVAARAWFLQQTRNGCDGELEETARSILCRVSEFGGMFQRKELNRTLWVMSSFEEAMSYATEHTKLDRALDKLANEPSPEYAEGEKISAKAVFLGREIYETFHSPHGEINYIHRYQLPGGMLGIWNTRVRPLEGLGEGDAVVISGTIKKIGQSKDGEPQVTLLRCKVVRP